MEHLGYFTTNYNGRIIENYWRYRQQGLGRQVQRTPLHKGETLVVGRLCQKESSLGDLARDSNTDREMSTWCFADPKLSATHLKIYSIANVKKSYIPSLVLAEDLSPNRTFHLGRVMGPARGAVVLQDGDSLKISDSVTLVWHQSDHTQKKLGRILTPDERTEIQQFQSQFEIRPYQLSHTDYGTVVLARNRLTGRQLACKIVNIRAADVQARLSKTVSAAEKIMREADILKTLCHPNVVRLEKVYHNDQVVYMLQELVAGGSLVDHIAESGGRLGNTVGMLIAKQILEGLKHCHEQGIVHRDVRAENILMSSRARCPRAILANFGQAAKLPDYDEGLQSLLSYSLAGTYNYKTQYLYHKNHTWMETATLAKATDVWSLGCLVYLMLVGKHPFSCSDASSAKRSQDPKSRELSIWENVSVGFHAKDFINRLLVADSKQRMTVEEALNHHWFTTPSIKSAVEEAYRHATVNYHSPHPYPNLIEPIVIPRGSFYMGRRTATAIVGRSLLPRPKLKPVPRRSAHLWSIASCYKNSRDYYMKRRVGLLGTIPVGSLWPDPALVSPHLSAPVCKPTATPRLAPQRCIKEPDALCLPPALLSETFSSPKLPLKHQTSKLELLGGKCLQMPRKRIRLS